jgi:hypothetical protein
MNSRSTRVADLLLPLCAGALLVLIAHHYDFFCDDAFITLRYAQNLAQHGAPVYNLGERVEGYTSFTWLLLAALGARAGAPLTGWVQLLGAAAGIGMIAATWALWRRLHPERRALGALVLIALAVSAPVAAWTMGGLETPLFAALSTASFALALDLAREASRARAIALGAVLGLSTLTRPEGALVAAAIFLPLIVVLARTRPGRAALAWVAASAGLIVGAHLAWRWSYYGYPLPNTFYVKSSGDTSLLRARGARYVAFAARELGVGVVAAVVLGLIGASSARAGSPASQPARRLLSWIARALVPAYVAYIALVGGDFLDLYRFFVPLLPLVFVLAASLLAGSVYAVARGAVALGLAVALVAGHAVHQYRLGERALQVAEPQRAEHGLEPLGWTRLYALRWAALGRWIAAHAERDDWMAVGAAGAMPYYAGIRNLDTFGLCDEWVAHSGPIVGHRPGHQRFAPEWYILQKRPAFLLIGNDYSSDAPRALRRDRRWDARGYVWAEARIDAAKFGAPRSFHHYFLMRRDRAEQHASSPYLRFASADRAPR